MVCGRLLNSWIVINHLVAIVFSNKVHMREEKHNCFKSIIRFTFQFHILFELCKQTSEQIQTSAGYRFSRSSAVISSSFVSSI